MKKNMSTGTIVKLAAAVTGAALLLGIAAWNVVWMSGAVEQYSAAPVSKTLVKAKYDALRKSAAGETVLSGRQSEGVHEETGMPLPQAYEKEMNAAGREESAREAPGRMEKQPLPVSGSGSAAPSPVFRTSPRERKERASAETVPQVRADVHDVPPAAQSKPVPRRDAAVTGISRQDDTLVVSIKNKKTLSGKGSAGTVTPPISAVSSSTASAPVYTVVTNPAQHPTSTSP
jgi:hypothetical protein